MTTNEKWWLQPEPETKRTKRQAKRIAQQKREEAYLKGRRVWCSSELIDGKHLGEGFEKGRLYKRRAQGTYVKKLHGPLPPSHARP